MKILVTGANGQVGHSLKSQLTSEKKFEFLALDRDSLDITSQNQVDKVVNDYKPDLIINAAAYTAVDRAENDSENATRINANGPGFLAKAANDIGAAIFHISTDYVFDGEKISPYLETDTANPQCVYGKSKLEGEKLVASFNQRHLILRTAWVFSEHGNNFVKTMLRLGNERDELNIVNDQKGAPTYAGDISKALLKAAEKLDATGSLPWGIYHFAGMPYVTWYEFAQQIFNEAESNNLISVPKIKSISSEQYPTPAKRPSNSILDCGKITAALGIQESNWKKALENIDKYVMAAN